MDVNQTGTPISEYIYGQLIEHLGNCFYGGLWAEMLINRKFYYLVTYDYNPWATDDDPQWNAGPYRYLNASPWKVIGSTNTVTVGTANPFVGSQTPLVHVPGDGTSAGISQENLGVLKDKKR